ncbi:winged helix-turn-helix transcriptional regulator [Halobaculum gomorrense]|uniref:Transcriptional regulator, HxlR family n=1 Tax=Halobaculum gomorrense TaxID=43928 RepID=A0A1M5TFM2_9EURY|nr:helix-turn-helix domain-containing protein [Halobaculum gomorrense]SHH49450.1 transcriptional regulator, HxlR family [Halobaculum gomorrense]
MSSETNEALDFGDSVGKANTSRVNVNWRAVRATLDQIGHKWHPSIIDELLVESPQRFSELEERLDGISSATLSNSLEDLQQKKLVTRSVQGTRPVRVQYGLTERGRSFEPVLVSLKNWGKANVCTKRFLQNKYHPEIIYLLMFNERLYFADLKDSIGLANKSLSDSLERLENIGIVARTVENKKPVRVSYSITERGESLSPVFQSLSTWGERELEIENR